MSASGPSSLPLGCEEVTVKFGSFVALNRVSLTFDEGRLYSIIGPNGAGKTTLINVLSGWQGLASGKVTLRGEDVTSVGPHGRARRSLGRSFQIVQIFPAMTVFENLRLAAQARYFGVQPFWRSIGGYGALRDRSEEMLGFIGLGRYRDAPAAVLSHGDQRRLEVGISLMNDPAILLLDEPMAGVGHHELDHMAELVGKVAKNRTVILIEHNMDVVMSISDEVVVMVEGRVVCRGPPEEIRRDRRVREAYLGDDADGHTLAG